MVQFDSVDPAALVVAIIAVIVSLEQLARAMFESQTKQMGKRMKLLLLSSEYVNTSRITDIGDDQFLLLVQVGLQAIVFLKNGRHPAVYSVLRRMPSSRFMGAQAWCIRRNFGIGAFVILLWSHFAKMLPWAWYSVRVQGGWEAWGKLMDWKFKHHNAGYSGKQFDTCIHNLFIHLSQTTDISITRLLLNVAQVASCAESDI